MGQDISISNDVNVITSHVTIIEGNINNNKVMEKIRSSSNISPRKQILNISVDSMPKNILNRKVALIFCNSYYGTKYDLGDCAINDGLLCYNKFKSYNYETFIFYDITSIKFKEILRMSLGLNLDKLTIYFIGHGTQIKDKNGDEVDCKDECLVFKDKLVSDDEISEIVNEKNTCKKLTLMADCCHSGSIYDIPSRSDIITISACNDSQTAKQDWINHKGNGVFSYYFWKYLSKCNNDGKILKDKLNIKLKKYSQTCIFNYLTDEVI